MTEVDGARDRVARSLVVCVFVAVLYASVLVGLSVGHFRLSGFPVNDDVHYFNEGIRILKLIDSGGYAGLFSHLREHPLHGPLSAVQAAVVFGLFGIHDWLPYASMTVVIAAWIYCVHRICRRYNLATLARVALFALALSSPIVVRTVVVYQPVFPCAAMMTLGSLGYLAGWPCRRDWKSSIAVALCWALALLYKPTFSPQVMLTMVVAAALGAFSLYREKTPWAALARRYLVNMGIVGVLAAPYYITAAEYLYNYIRAVTVNPPVRFELDWFGHLLFHLTGPGGELMLGATLATLLALIISWIALAVRAPQPGERFFLGSLLFLTLMNFALFAVNPHKQEYIAPPFHYLLLVTAVLGAARIMSQFWGQVSTRVALAALVICTFVITARVDYLDPWLHGDWADRRALMSQIIHALQRSGAGAGKKVFFTTSGYIAVNSVWYEIAKSGAPVPEIRDYAFADKLAILGEGIREADYVVASAPEYPEVWDFLPTTKLAGDSLLLARRDPGLVLVAHAATKPGHEYFIFRRHRAASSAR